MLAMAQKEKSTTVVDIFRELGNVYGSDDSEQELDGYCQIKLA